MSNYRTKQSGGLWHPVSSKAYAFTFMTLDGFAGAMHATATAGSIRQAHLASCGGGMIVGRPKHANSAYLTTRMGGGFAETFKNILSKIVSIGSAAHEAGLTGAIGNLIGRLTGAPGKAPMPTAPGHPPGTTPGLNQGEQPERKRGRYGAVVF